MTLLSLKLFDHCSVDYLASVDDNSIQDCIFSSTLELSECTSTLLIEDTFDDLSSAICECLEYTTDLLESGSFTIDSSVNDIETHDTSTYIDDSSSWGFMLNDSGGMSTFDDSHGAVDWFDDELGISNNCNF